MQVLPLHRHRGGPVCSQSIVWTFQWIMKILILVNFYQILFWTIPALCVQFWIEKFKENCKTQPALFSYRSYQKLSSGFSYFFLLFYLVLQLLSIINIFLSIAKERCKRFGSFWDYHFKLYFKSLEIVQNVFILGVGMFNVYCLF